MSFNLEKMILAEAVKAGHIRLKDLTEAGVLSQPLSQIPKDEEEKLLTRMVTDGEFTIDSLQSKGILDQETIDALMEVIFDEENASSISPGQHLGTEISTFSHYANLEHAGSGAMAEVYKAYDRNLQRYVALKVLKVSDPNLIQRFIREARSQAQIEHSNICKIYEAGEFQGRSFIAMQYINGKTLKEMSGELSAEVKIDLMRQIAEAVHEAHRKGLIHRDLKPANLMVEEKDGALIPYVVDFGLVREAGAPGLTQTDILMGSPYYMSPEQASGKVHSLDRRTDIYSLGVTLYELFSGTLPFAAEDNILILRKIVEQDPAPLRKANRFIPRDLETIILKCLEKDPEKRYDTAKDLSEDLQRYLNGEAIHAKPSTFFYRLSKKAKRNKPTVVILGLAFLLVCFFGWIGIQSRVTARRQIVVAQQFGEDVNQVESMMRIARMRPLHDISTEQEMARKRIEHIGQEAEKLGTVAFAPGEYAMGKGYLVLQDYEKARQHLEMAWRHGYRKSDVASVLGQTFVALYQEKLREIDKITDNKSREEQRSRIQKTYRDPALQYLKSSSGAVRESQEFTEALIAYMERRYDVALKKSGSAYARNGWLYEAKKIQADIHVELARQSRDAGDYETSMAEYLKANKDYWEAITIGRSDASLYEGISSSKTSMMLMEIYYRGGDPISHFKEAVRFSNQALQVHSRDVRAHELLAEANWRMGEYEVRNGRDPSRYLENSLKTVQTALAIDPSVELYRIMASAYWSLSIYQNSQGQDERPSLQRSIQASQKALQIDPRSQLSLNLMGLAYYGLALYESAHAQDPHPNFQKAVQAFQEALEVQPNTERVHSNLANVYYEKAAYEFAQGQDVRASAQKSIEAYQRALKINPKAAATWSNLGSPYMILASYEIEHGGDPRVSLGKALEGHVKAQGITPNFHQPYNNTAAVLTLLASYEIMQGLNPTATLQKAVENCEKALKVRPNYAFAYTNLGTSYRYLAESQKKNPVQRLKKADQAYTKSLELSPNNSEALNGRGNTALAEAQWLISRKKNPQDAFSRAGKAFEDVLRTNPENMETLLGLAELHRWRAEWLLKTRQSPSKEVQAGLAIISKIVSTHPQLAKVFAVQGVLYLIQSKEKINATEKAKLLDQARQSLEKALSLNRNLSNQYASYIKESDIGLDQ